LYWAKSLSDFQRYDFAFTDPNQGIEILTGWKMLFIWFPPRDCVSQSVSIGQEGSVFHIHPQITEGGVMKTTKRSTGKTAKTRHITTTSKGFRIRTYEAPPPEFSPLTAAPRLLLHHGFPTRPDAKTQSELRRCGTKPCHDRAHGSRRSFERLKGSSDSSNNIGRLKITDGNVVF
jgi:hypothetical protein